MERQLIDQEIVRREKVNKLIELGVRPFGQRYDVTHHTKNIFDAYGNLNKEQLSENQINVKVAGRIVLKRGQGKAGFMHIQDKLGRIQLYIRQDNVSELDFEVYKLSDLGDIDRKSVV